MNRKSHRLGAAVGMIILGSITLSGTAHAAQLIEDGDFSSPNQNGSFHIYSPGIDGWMNDNGDGVEIGKSSIYGLGCANTTCQNLEVNANGFDTDSQTVTGLVVGQKYTLSWLYGGRTAGGPDILNVYFQDNQSGHPTGQALAVDTASTGAWTSNTFTITATSATETLYFASADTSAKGGNKTYGNEVANVSLTGPMGPVAGAPEPETWAMMILGAGLCGGAFRLNRRRDDAGNTAARSSPTARL